MPQPRRRQRLLTAATLLAASPAATRATTYDLSFQSVNVATAPYTAADTLNLNGVTFSSSLTNATLLPSLFFASGGGSTVTTTGNITFAGSLAGTGSLNKTGTGSLTLTVPSPSFTGLVFTSSPGTLKLTDPLALGPASTSPITFAGTLDVSSAFPVRPLLFSFATFLNNSPIPVTLGPAGSILPNFGPSLTFGGTGDITFAVPCPSALYITKSGTITLTYSTNTTLQNTLSVNAGTLALGINAPFSGTGGISVNSGATLDLNGFSSAGIPITVTSGGTLVNNNPASTPNLATFPAGSVTFGGSANINLTAKASSFTKTGPGTLSLSAVSNAPGIGITLNDGTVQLNHTSAAGNSSTSSFALNGTATTGGVLDLNGYPAPAGTYTFNGGTLANNNTSTPSTLDLSTSHLALYSSSSHYVFGGKGEIIINGNLPSTFYNVGDDTLTLNPTTPNSGPTGTFLGGTVKLGNAYASGTFNLYGTNVPGAPFRASTLDLNGRNFSAAAVTLALHSNAGIVNNNTATPASFDSGNSISFPDNVTPPFHAVLGGNGTLNLTTNFAAGRPIDKIGTGLLTLPAFFSPASLTLRAGTLQAESTSQLGTSISFLGGTLRIAPLYLPPQPSYTFTPTLSVDPTTGGTLDTPSAPSTFTGLLTGSGPFTKTGSASALLNPSPSSRLALTLSAGTLLLRPATGTPHLTALSLAPNTSLDTPSLILDYTDLPTTADQLGQYLQSHQLLFSLSPKPLGYAPQPDHTLLVQPALNGDANLDGTINADDYALLDAGYARHATHWYQGDFNNDGTIDNQDYLLIDQTYLGQAPGFTPGFLATRESQFGPTYVATLLASVPEPTLPLFSILYPLSSLLPQRRPRLRRRSNP